MGAEYDRISLTQSSRYPTGKKKTKTLPMEKWILGTIGILIFFTIRLLVINRVRNLKNLKSSK